MQQYQQACYNYSQKPPMTSDAENRMGMQLSKAHDTMPQYFPIQISIGCLRNAF